MTIGKLLRNFNFLENIKKKNYNIYWLCIFSEALTCFSGKLIKRPRNENWIARKWLIQTWNKKSLNQSELFLHLYKELATDDMETRNPTTLNLVFFEAKKKKKKSVPRFPNNIKESCETWCSGSELPKCSLLY